MLLVRPVRCCDSCEGAGMVPSVSGGSTGRINPSATTQGLGVDWAQLLHQSQVSEVAAYRGPL